MSPVFSPCILAVLGSMQELSSLTSNLTCASCNGGAMSEPLDCQGSPYVSQLKKFILG